MTSMEKKQLIAQIISLLEHLSKLNLPNLSLSHSKVLTSP